MIRKLFPLLMIALILTGCAVSEGQEQNVTTNAEQPGLYISLSDFDEALFWVTLKDKELQSYEDVKGIISTHHALASEMIHNLFRSIQVNDYDSVIIIGPDHNSREGLTIITSDAGWSTPFGTLELNKTYHQRLLQHPYMAVNNIVMKNEHSSGAIIPYIKYYFPDASINTVAIPATMNLNESEEFGVFLSEMIDVENTLLVASLDFSHYLPVPKAYAMDEITIKAIQEKNYREIMQFTNDNVDSPQTLIAFLTYMNEIDYSKEILLDHKNSYDLVPANYHFTTSYFSFIIY
ncbi:MAG TPA: AmmeMemoRadiSam system protein B [Clostridiales bacterium]|nr:AmmeMemoRadiSam system protein B [Clostridiales bacterium]